MGWNPLPRRSRHVTSRHSVERRGVEEEWGRGEVRELRDPVGVGRNRSEGLGGVVTRVEGERKKTSSLKYDVVERGVK